MSEPNEMTWVYRPAAGASQEPEGRGVPVHGVSAPASDGRMQVVLANGDRVWASPRDLVLELPSVPRRRGADPAGPPLGEGG